MQPAQEYNELLQLSIPCFCEERVDLFWLRNPVVREELIP
jgi:hypothetical protein